jgi:hypothetical protein
MYFITTNPKDINSYVLFHNFGLMKQWAINQWDIDDFYLGECFFNNYYTKNYRPFFQKALCTKEKFVNYFHEDSHEFMLNFQSAIVLDTEFPHFENDQYAKVKKQMDSEIKECIKKLLEIRQSIDQ